MSPGLGLAERGASAPNEAEWERLVLEHLPQVRYIAHRIHDRLPPQVELDDLIHAGIVGLMDAFQKFDAGKKAQLKTYAKFRIRGAILDSLRQLDWGPRELRRRAREIEEAHWRLRGRLGRTATEQEVAAELGVNLAQFQQELGELKGLEISSLYTPWGEEGQELSLTEVVADSNDQDPLRLCLEQERTGLLAQAIDQLPEKERQVMSLYYFDELTMKEVGEVLRVGESRVSQLHSSALLRLRALLQELLEPGVAPLVAKESRRLQRTAQR